jgi:uncharacterized protein (TIGR02246 family)
MKIYLSAFAGLILGLAMPAAAQQTTTCEGPKDVCQKIVELWTRWVTAFNKKDAAGTAAVFTADAVWSGERTKLSGTEAFTKFYDDAFKAGATNASSIPDQVHVVGDMAWSVGSWSDTGPGPNNTTQLYHGNWGAVAVNDGGIWKIRMLSWSVDEPQPAR